ncbi:MAG: ABC transporter permease subunit [Gemmatimonadota bacterium]
MIPPAVRAVFGLEIRSLLRDVRTVLISVVLPVVLIPAILLASNFMEERQAEREDTRVYRLALTGPDSAFARGLIEGVLRTEGGEEGGAAGESGRFRLLDSADPLGDLEAGDLDLYLEAFTPDAWRETSAREESSVEVPGEFDGARVLRIRVHSSRGASRTGGETLRSHLLEVRESRRDSIMVQAGLPVAPEGIARVEEENVASDEEVQGERLGRFLTLILVGLMLLGGSAVATDTLAGEKERGTLTTLLTSAASRGEIVSGKLLAIMAVALAIALVQILNLWVYLGLGIIDPSQGFSVTISPGLALGLFMVYLPMVALTAAVLLLTSAHARSYKEAQLYMTPVLLGMSIPTLAPLLPGISLQSAVIVVPIANLSVGVRDLLVGQAHLPSLGVAWMVTAIVAAWFTVRSVRALHDEELITGDTSEAEFLGGPALFRKRVLLWFVGFWAVKFLFDVNVRFEDIRVTILVSVGLVFLLFPLILIQRFRLDPAQALALRRPHPGVWLGVAIGAPAGVFAAGTVMHLMDFVIPVPTELLENFGQTLFQEGIPAWQLILLVAVVPGITEELTFRGLLVHGLRRRFGPVALTLAVGIIFGLFHVDLFRIPVTAFLGVVLTAVTLMSGSIFPAIVWHVIHNGIIAWMGTRGVEAGEEAGWWMLGSMLLVALALAVIWRFRTPYPGVGRPGRMGRGTDGGTRPPT